MVMPGFEGYVSYWIETRVARTKVTYFVNGMGFQRMSENFIYCCERKRVLDYYEGFHFHNPSTRQQCFGGACLNPRMPGFHLKHTWRIDVAARDHVCTCHND